MTQPIKDALAAIVTVVSGVSGIAQAPTNPNETQNAFPFAVTYYTRGSLAAVPVGTKKDLFDVAIDVLTKKIFLPNDLATLIPFLDTVSAALIAEVSDTGDQFGGKITTFDSVQISFIPLLDYAGVPMIGYRFMMTNVKILVNT